MTNISGRTKILCEGAICIALSLALSYLEIPIGLSFGGFGGSVNLVMIPLIVFAVRAGAFWGVAAGLIFGTLKYIFAEGFAISWVSIIFDYSVAYACVGFAGILKQNYKMMPLAALIGCAVRFAVHFFSGVTVYAMYMPEEFMGMAMTSPVVYSILYNGTYMLPNTIIAVAVCFVLKDAVAKIK